MDPKFKTSFIPKKPFEMATGKRVRRGASVITVAALIIFLGSLAASLGVYLYTGLLKQSIEQKGADLERAKGEFEPELIRELTRLDRRLSSSKELLDGHIALSTTFSLIESLTLQSVQFESFKYEHAGADKIALIMKGRARSFASVALQSDVFGKSPFLRDPLFANPNLDPKGDVIFDFSALLDPRLLSYRDLIEQQQQTIQP